MWLDLEASRKKSEEMSEHEVPGVDAAQSAGEGQMTFKISSGETVVVHFFHIHNDSMPKKDWRCVATVDIGDHEVMQFLFRGESRIHPNDSYSKITGRKVALRRALEEVPRSTRTEIWRALIQKGMRLT